MKAFIILIVILNYLVIGILSNWCVERKLVRKTRHRWNHRDSMFPQRETFFNFHHRRIFPVETYLDYELQRVCCFGYRQIGDVCQPICMPDCPVNSTCFAPDRCHCNNGYYGHDDIPHLMNCQPYCNEPCPLHAKCIAPNVCSCLEGYHLSNQSTCEPICSNNCDINAYCEAPDTCACHQNYQLIDNVCQPICENGCPTNAKCTEPNKCGCNENYQMKMTSLYEHYCEPICEPSCINGICIEPNSCKCYDNYQMTSNVTLCEPLCKDGCTNGKCIAPDMCECEDGYLMGPDNTCQPVCKEPCQMGQCVQPNVCKCLEGYTLKENSSSICEPICEPMCENGICAAPNFCICHQNFTYADDNNITHVCIPIINLTSTTTEITEIEATETDVTQAETVEMEMETGTTKLSNTHNSQEQETTTIIEYTEFTITTRADKMQNTIVDEVKSTTQNYVINDEAAGTSTIDDNNCFQYCQCWQESGNTKALPHTRCEHFCVDQYDQPCLNVTQCKCRNRQLYCLNSNENENNVEYIDNHDSPLVFDCKLWRNLIVSNENIAEHRQSTTASLSQWPWLIAIGSVVLASIVASIVLIYWYSHRTESNYMVQYDQGA